jgi:hypothetical protein
MFDLKHETGMSEGVLSLPKVEAKHYSTIPDTLGRFTEAGGIRFWFGRRSI